MWSTHCVSRTLRTEQDLTARVEFNLRLNTRALLTERCDWPSGYRSARPLRVRHRGGWVCWSAEGTAALLTPSLDTGRGEHASSIAMEISTALQVKLAQVLDYPKPLRPQPWTARCSTASVLQWYPEDKDEPGLSKTIGSRARARVSTERVVTERSMEAVVSAVVSTTVTAVCLLFQQVLS